MEDKSNISIFRGSAVEADTVHDFLAQQDIASLVRNHMQENLDAGWVTASSEHAAEVFVAKEDQARAADLLKNLFPDETETNTVVADSSQPLQDRTPVTRVIPEIPVIIATPRISVDSERRPTPPPPAPMP